jgi:hypothetical protein
MVHYGLVSCPYCFLDFSIHIMAEQDDDQAEASPGASGITTLLTIVDAKANVSPDIEIVGPTPSNSGTAVWIVTFKSTKGPFRGQFQNEFRVSGGLIQCLEHSRQ